MRSHGGSRPLAHMTLLLVLLTWCLAPLGARAGSPAPGASDAPAPDLEGVQWVLTQVVLDGSLVDLPPDAPAATMHLWHGFAIGNGGCNAWSAGYALDGSAITFSDIRITLRECLVAAPAEAPLLDALPRIASWSIADRLLTLADGEGAPLLVATSDIQPSTGIRGVWRIAALAAADGTPVDPLSLGQASASFGDGQFRATVGCNWITGSYVQDGSPLAIQPTFRTMMGCGALMEPEDVLADALPAVTSAVVDGDAVQLVDAAGTTRIRLTPARAQQPQPSPSAGP